MTALLAKAPAAAHFGIGRFFRDQIAATKAAYAARAEYTKVYNELSAMDDRDLADIGLSRGMIHDIAAAAAAK